MKLEACSCCSCWLDEKHFVEYKSKKFCDFKCAARYFHEDEDLVKNEIEEKTKYKQWYPNQGTSFLGD